MAYTNKLRDTLDNLMLSAEQIEELLRVFDLHALGGTYSTGSIKICNVRRELLLIDADMAVETSTVPLGQGGIGHQ